MRNDPEQAEKNEITALTIQGCYVNMIHGLCTYLYLPLKERALKVKA
jgi:hypothetical protein